MSVDSRNRCLTFIQAVWFHFRIIQYLYVRAVVDIDDSGHGGELKRRAKEWVGHQAVG